MLQVEISEYDTDEDEARGLCEGEFDHIYDSLSWARPLMPRLRYRQLHRWHRGANKYIRLALRRTRRKWCMLSVWLLQRIEFRRYKLFKLVYQKFRLSSVIAFEGLFSRRLHRLFDSRLTHPLRIHVGEFLDAL